MDERKGMHNKVIIFQEGLVAPKAPIPIMIFVEEGNNLNATILQIKKDKEELEEISTRLHVRRINWTYTLM